MIDNILLVLATRLDQPDSQHFHIVKEFNLIQEFPQGFEVDLLPQETTVATKKMQSLQLLTFTLHTSQSTATFKKNNYKSFLMRDQSKREEHNMSGFAMGIKGRNCRSPYASFACESTKSFKKIQIRLDSIVETAFSAKKDRSTS